MDFKRQLFIVDLFHPEQIINAFNYIEFNSIEAFKKATKMDYFNIKEGNTLQININKFADFKFLVYLNKVKKELFTKMKVIILVPSKELLNEIMSKPIPDTFNMSILTTQPFMVADYWKVNSKWIKKHIIGLIHNINAETIATDMCNITEYYNIYSLRFFKLDIDYESFSKVAIKDVGKLEYWFNYLRVWLREKNQPIEILSSDFYRKIFVDDDLSLYLDAHKDKDTWFFPSLLEYEGVTGENIQAKALNNLHKYLDLSKQSLYGGGNTKNWHLIDFHQINKMGYFINEIPLIMELVQRWLYGN